MDNTALSLKLKQEAVSLGLCNEWQNAWKDNSSQQELISKYLRGIDFCLQHDWPSVRFINSRFDRDLLRKNGILVNDRRSLLNPKIAVLLGHSEGIIRINGEHSSTVYVRHSSSADIYIHTEELVIVHVFDNASVNVIVGDGYKPDTLVLSHSKSATVQAPKSVKFKEELDYLK